MAAILCRRASLGPTAFVFGTENGECQANIQTAWDTLRLLACGFEPRRDKDGDSWNPKQLCKIDLHWHDLRHERASGLLADGVDIRIIQLMLGHATVQQTQRYLNVTDEELRRPRGELDAKASPTMCSRRAGILHRRFARSTQRRKVRAAGPPVCRALDPPGALPT